MRLLNEQNKKNLEQEMLEFEQLLKAEQPTFQRKLTLNREMDEHYQKLKAKVQVDGMYHMPDFDYTDPRSLKLQVKQEIRKRSKSILPALITVSPTLEQFNFQQAKTQAFTS